MWKERSGVSICQQAKFLLRALGQRIWRERGAQEHPKHHLNVLLPPTAKPFDFCPGNLGGEAAGSQLGGGAQEAAAH